MSPIGLNSRRVLNQSTPPAEFEAQYYAQVAVA